MTVKEIVKEYLKVNGFTGLHSDGCGCTVDDLAPCGEIIDDCEAGYRRECAACELLEQGDGEGGDGCICEEGRGDGCTSSRKPHA